MPRIALGSLARRQTTHDRRLPSWATILSVTLIACSAPPAVDAGPSLDAGARPDAESPDAESPDAGSDAAADAGNPHGFAIDLGYVPSEAEGLELLEDTPFALGDEASEVLERPGCGRLRDRRFYSFSVAMATIYAHDLPLYISADAVLDALHRTFRDLLAWIEVVELRVLLGELLARLHEKLESSSLDAVVRASLDEYLAVARALLDGTEPELQADGDPAAAARWVALVTAAEGASTEVVFGEARPIDFSRFLPRGHYTEGVWGERYFRAMSWLSAIDFRLVSSVDGEGQVSRAQVDAGLGLRSLFDAEALTIWRTIEAHVRGFFGDPDAMNPESMAHWLTDLGEPTASNADEWSDEDLLTSLEAGGYGEQRIAGHFLYGGDGETEPLPRAFALFPLRYVVDSHVLSELVYDRVGDGRIERLMPSTFDVAYAALGNNYARVLLADELQAHPYEPDLEAARAAVEALDVGSSGTLYDGWLAALRELSPPLGAPPAMPTTFQTEAWARRQTSSQLASWSQLRHDALLYAKPSQTGGFACEYPDAYVDPYPEFWRRLAEIGQRGIALIDQLPPTDDPRHITASARQAFEALRSVSLTLAEMAERELAGEPFTDEQMAFVNRAVTTDGCADIRHDELEGWYIDLLVRPFGDAPRIGEMEATVVDVHTQPTDAAGAVVGRVLSAGVGLPRAMVVTVDGCDGPRAYVGPVFSYHERLTEGFERWTDEQMLEAVLTAEPADVPFMSGLVTGPPNATPLTVPVD